MDDGGSEANKAECERKECQKRVIYLASPYSDPESSVREERFRAACRAAARLIRGGEVVFSPIAHGHPIAQHELPADWRFWERHDRWHLQRCDEVVVLMLAGWKESLGVQAEIRIAAELGKRVRYVEPDDDDMAATPVHKVKETTAQ